jgi:hypothetical protein
LDFFDVFGEAGVIWLKSTQMLWKKYRKKDKLYGITSSHYDHFVVLNSSFFSSSSISSAEDDIKQFGSEEFRIFLVGLIIDLIRICSITSNDIQFWKGFIDSISRT